MNCITIIAASGGDVTDSEGGGATGNFGGGGSGSDSGDSWIGAHSSSRIYFDSWTDDEEAY